jgi:hypothetical protein
MTRISSKKVKQALLVSGDPINPFAIPSVSSCLTWTAIHSSRLPVQLAQPVQRAQPGQPVRRAHRAQ